MPVVSHATCGATTTLGAANNGSEGFSGSVANTSSPAAAKWPPDSAAVSAEEVLYLIQDWFSHHILGTDMEFKPYVKDIY